MVLEAATGIYYKTQRPCGEMAPRALCLLNTRQFLYRLPNISVADMQRHPYTSLTLPQLRQELARRGLAIPPSARKINLVQALDAHDASSETLPTASFSSQTSHTHGPAHSTSSAAALTHAAGKTTDEALDTAAARAAEALFDVQSALIVFKSQSTSDSQAALAAVLGSVAYVSGGYTALKGQQLEIATHYTVRCFQGSQSTTCTNAQYRMH